MDSLTQIVLGAAVGEATLGRRVGNKALLWGGIAGTIPDLDVLFTSGDAIREIVIHRGFSHSILFAVLMAPLLGYLTKQFYEMRGRAEATFRQWSWLFFWAIFTHPLLDSLTTYGTQLFLPFSDHRVSIASVFVVDLFYTVPFLLTVIGVSMMNRQQGLRKWLNWIGIAISTAYLAAGLMNKRIAADVFRADIAKEMKQSQLVFTGVTPLNIFLWYGVAETDSAFHIGYYSIMDDSEDVEWVSFDKQHERLKPIEDEYGVDRLRWFSDGLFIVREESPGVLNFYTIKFGRSNFTARTAEESFPFFVRVDMNGENGVTYTTVRRVKEMNLKENLKTLKNRALGRSVL